MADPGSGEPVPITSVTVLFHLPGVGLLYTHPCPTKITFIYNSVLTLFRCRFVLHIFLLLLGLGSVLGLGFRARVRDR